jgi:DNA primase catalytic subunit
MFKFEHLPKKVEYFNDNMCNFCWRFISKIIMFQEALQFKDVIIIYYIEKYY